MAQSVMVAKWGFLIRVNIIGQQTINDLILGVRGNSIKNNHFVHGKGKVYLGKKKKAFLKKKLLWLISSFIYAPLWLLIILCGVLTRS